MSQHCLSTSASAIQQQRLLRSIDGLFLARGVCIGCLILATGCRTPWQPQTLNPEPSFDRLIELEQANNTPMAPSQALAQRRPGYNSAQSRFGESIDDLAIEGTPSRHSVAEASATRKIADVDVTPTSGSSSAEQLEMLRRTQLALENQKNAQPSSRAARRTFSDDTTASSDEAVAFHLNDQESFDSLPSNEKDSQVAESRQDSNVKDQTSPTENNDAVQLASHSSTQRSNDVQLANFNKSSTSSHEPLADLTWEEHLHEALVLLSEEDASVTNPRETVRREAVARMLHLAIGNVDEMERPIEGLQTHEQEYFQHQLKALYDALDPMGNPVASRRWSLTMLSQRKAHEALAAVSNLEVNNVAFCTEVESFGVISKFPKYEFSADQEVLLYCELDNFVSTTIRDGFETQLQGSYEIVDSTGRRIADQLLPMDSHVCRNHRRDYFIAYRIYMPQNIDAGQYTLKLTIEDMKGRKFGQSDIEFEVR